MLSLKIAVFLSIASLAFAQPKAVKFCFENKDYFPYVVGVKDKQYSGILVDHLFGTFKKFPETKFELIAKPWVRCQEELKNGQVDAIFAAIWTKERDRWAMFPKKRDGSIDHTLNLEKGHYVFFKHKNGKIQWDGKKLQNVQIGISAPYGYVAYKKLQKANQLYEGRIPAEQGFQLVASGKLDAYVIDKKIGNYLVKKLKLEDKITQIPTPYFVDTWHVPFSRKFAVKHKKWIYKFLNELQETKKGK